MFPLSGEALRKSVAQPGVFFVNHANPKQNEKEIVDISTSPWYTAKDQTKRRLFFMIQRFDAFVSGIRRGINRLAAPVKLLPF